MKQMTFATWKGAECNRVAESPVPERPSLSVVDPGLLAASTLEARWMLPGRVPEECYDWLLRFPVTSETRQDLYLVCPQMSAVSVKVRGLARLDLKLMQPDSWTLDIPGHARGRMNSFQKWSFRLASLDKDMTELGDWKAVRKQRFTARFDRSGQPLLLSEASGDLGGRSEGCSVELTDVAVDGEVWWTLAFEAEASPSNAWGSMEAALGSVFADPMPAGVRLSRGESMAYSQWMQRRNWLEEEELAEIGNGGGRVYESEQPLPARRSP